MSAGSSHAIRSTDGASILPNNDPGNVGGGAYMGTAQQPTIEDWENMFGPAGRDVKQDPQRSKRHQRWHLPDVLKGPNVFLTDRVDGLITDATSSPFTSLILPYHWVPNPDQAMSWDVWSYDEGLASRVPYESAARTLTQTKRTHQAFAVRQGLAITMEHNFMMSERGRRDFQNQLLQLVGSIQYTNDLDVHLALISAPNYERIECEKYAYNDVDPYQILRKYTDMYGYCQKNPNGLDVLIEDARQVFRKWGAKEPSFMLANPKLGFQQNMTLEKTQYLTNGIDGVKRLRAGPEMKSYRGLNVINTRHFSMEAGRQPRDLLRRRVRVAEYYATPPLDFDEINTLRVRVYDENKDQMVTLTGPKLWDDARLGGEPTYDEIVKGAAPAATITAANNTKHVFFILRPTIEHEMLGVIIGRGGTEDLGGTVWGQTSLSCHDDSVHQRWGMQYRYHARSIVWNEKHLLRLWDVAFAGYNGGMGTKAVDWTTANPAPDRTPRKFSDQVLNLSEPIRASRCIDMLVMRFEQTDIMNVDFNNLPNPVCFYEKPKPVAADPDGIYTVFDKSMNIFGQFSKPPGGTQNQRYENYITSIPDMASLHADRKSAGHAANEGDTHQNSLAFSGTCEITYKPTGATAPTTLMVRGSGHLGPSFPGCASIRAGNGSMAAPQEPHVARIV